MLARRKSLFKSLKRMDTRARDNGPHRVAKALVGCSSDHLLSH